MGYTFLWPAGQRPYFILPNKRIVTLEVIGDVPYLIPGSETAQPRRRQGRRCFACGAADNALSHQACPGSSTDPVLAGAQAPSGTGEPQGIDEALALDTPEDADALLGEAQRRDLRAEAHSVAHLCTITLRIPIVCTVSVPR